MSKLYIEQAIDELNAAGLDREATAVADLLAEAQALREKLKATADVWHTADEAGRWIVEGEKAPIEWAVPEDVSDRLDELLPKEGAERV